MVIPLEILYNILELCPRDVLLNTCMVSRGAHRTSVPLLYQEFAPDRPKQMVLFFKTILRNPGLGKYVESVVISLEVGTKHLPTRSFFRLMTRAFSFLPKITDLALDISEIPSFALSAITLPKLSFLVLLHLTTDKLHFLYRHRESLQDLIFNDGSNVFIDGSEPPPILPKLRSLNGPPNVVPHILAPSLPAFHCLEVIWGDHITQGDYQPVIDAFESACRGSNHPMLRLFILRCTRNIDLFCAVARQMPHLTHLFMRYGNPTREVSESEIDVITSHMGKFSRLEHLDWIDFFWDDIKSEEYELVNRFQKACPSLRSWRAFGGRMWCRHVSESGELSSIWRKA